MLPANGQAASLFLGELPPDIAMVERMVRAHMELHGSSLLFYEEFCAAVTHLPDIAREAERRARLEDAADYEDDDEEPDRFDKRADRAAQRARERLMEMGPDSPILRELRRVSRFTNLTPTFEGWKRYLGTQGPIDQAFRHPAFQRQGHFHEAGLEESVLVVAPRKWGKSELLKALIYHHVDQPYDTNPGAAVIVLDPGGDLVQQAARWPELSGPDRVSNRLIYVEPELRDGLTVGFNPLDGTGLDHRSRNQVAGMLAEALGALTADLTVQMRTLVVACCTVLLGKPGATLRSLQIMLRDPDTDPQAAALQAEARDYADDDGIRDWFRREFLTESYRGTRAYLRNRLNDLLVTYDFAGMFGGTATVNLRAAVEGRKVVLVNLAKFDNEDAVRLAGRLFVTMIGAIARRRAQTPDAPRTPIHLVIDEATVLAGNELVRALAQLRKWGLNLILAQQVMGSGFTPADKETLIRNTGCRFIGGRDRRVVADMLTNGRDYANELPHIERMNFWTEWPEVGGPTLLKVRSDLAGFNHAVPRQAWEEYVDEATDPLAGYYRASKLPPLPQPEAPAAPPLRVTPTAPDPVPATDAGTVVPPAPKPRRRSPAKPVDLVAQEGVAPKKPRAKRSANSPVPSEKPPEVRKGRRKLD